MTNDSALGVVLVLGGAVVESENANRAESHPASKPPGLTWRVTLSTTAVDGVDVQGVDAGQLRPWELCP